MKDRRIFMGASFAAAAGGAVALVSSDRISNAVIQAASAFRVPDRTYDIPDTLFTISPEQAKVSPAESMQRIKELLSLVEDEFDDYDNYLYPEGFRFFVDYFDGERVCPRVGVLTVKKEGSDIRSYSYKSKAGGKDVLVRAHLDKNSIEIRGATVQETHAAFATMIGTWTRGAGRGEVHIAGFPLDARAFDELGRPIPRS